VTLWVSPVLATNHVVTLVEASEENLAEVDRPDAVVDFLEPDVMLLEGVGDEQQPVFEAECARVGDALDEKVSWIIQRRELLWERPGRGAVDRSRGTAGEVFMRPFLVEECSERVEGPLLSSERAAWWPDGFGLQGLVHTLVRPVLLGMGGQDALVLNPEAHPPDVELREAVDAGGSEGHAVVGADGEWESEGAEGVLHSAPHSKSLRTEQALAGEQVTRVLVGKGQRVAVAAVTGAKMTLEVGGPEIIGTGGGWGHDSRVEVRPASASLLDQTEPREQIASGAGSGQGDVGVAWCKPVEDLAWSPAGVGAPRGADELGRSGGNAMRTVPRGTAEVVQCSPAAFLEATEPLVARLAADAVALAELGHGVQAAPVIGDEAFTLFHG
jgi:hypothetical protein